MSKPYTIAKDRHGVVYTRPSRSCKKCINYPCFKGIENRACDFAKYGCIQFRKK